MLTSLLGDSLLGRIDLMYLILIYNFSFTGYSLTYQHLIVPLDSLGQVAISSKSYQTSITSVCVCSRYMVNVCVSCVTVSTLHHVHRFRGEYIVYRDYYVGKLSVCYEKLDCICTGPIILLYTDTSVFGGRL